MNIDLGMLLIKKIIIHEIPKKITSEQIDPILSEIESPLDDELLLFFRNKVIGSIGSSNSFNVNFIEGAQTPVPELVKEYLLGKNSNFVEISQKIAMRLHDCQNAVNPGGLLTIIDCEFEGEKALGILKVEKEEGVRLNQSTVNGKRTFNIRYIKDLLFTEKTKLFKIGLFSKKEGNEFEGVVCDHQRGYFSTFEVARFFLTDFLGCKLLEEPSITTKKFYEASEEFINKEIRDPVLKTNLQIHLISELSNQKTTINPDDFAKNYLPVELRKIFMDTLNEKEIPTNTIEKDIELIASRIKKTALEFASGISVIGTNEVMKKKVNISKLNNGETKLELIDELKKVSSK